MLFEEEEEEPFLIQTLKKKQTNARTRDTTRGGERERESSRYIASSLGSLLLRFVIVQFFISIIRFIHPNPFSLTCQPSLEYQILNNNGERRQKREERSKGRKWQE